MLIPVVPNQEKQNHRKVSCILNCFYSNHIKLENKAPLQSPLQLNYNVNVDACLETSDENRFTEGIQWLYATLESQAAELRWKRCAWAILVSVQPNFLTPLKALHSPSVQLLKGCSLYMKTCKLPGIFFTQGHEKCLLWIRILKMQLHKKPGDLCVCPLPEHKVKFSPVPF